MVHKKTADYLASWHSFQIFGWNLGFHMVPQSLRNHSATESPAWPTFGGQHADLSTGSVQLREDFMTAVENQSYMVYSALALAYHMKERIQGYGKLRAVCTSIQYDGSLRPISM